MEMTVKLEIWGQQIQGIGRHSSDDFSLGRTRGAKFNGMKCYFSVIDPFINPTPFSYCCYMPIEIFISQFTVTTVTHLPLEILCNFFETMDP